MSDTDEQNEPTMEEILASIRRIISEDSAEEEEEEAKAEAASEPEPEPEAEPEPQEEFDSETDLAAAEAPEEEPVAEEEDEEVLELTQMVGDDGGVVDLNAQREQRAAPEPQPEPEPEPEAEPFDDEDDDIALVQDSAPEPQPAPPPSPEPDRSLLEDTTRAAATASLLELAAASSARDALSGDTIGSRTLEGLVREALEPHLKSWLDANLPILVERIVREEIQKMVKRAEYR